MDWQPLLGQASGLSIGLVLAVGFVVGWASTLSGLGAGLALPMLAAAGLPLPAALLSVKLPVTMADLAGTLGACRQSGVGLLRTLLSPACLLAAVAGAGAGATVLAMPVAWMLAAAPPLAVLAWHQRRAARETGRHACRLALSWGAYVGLFGVGAGLLWRSARGARIGEAQAGPLRDGLAWRAAANAGALSVLLLAGQQTTAWVALLAAAQALGAFIAMRRRAGRRGWPGGWQQMFRRARA